MANNDLTLANLLTKVQGDAGTDTFAKVTERLEEILQSTTIKDIVIQTWVTLGTADDPLTYLYMPHAGTITRIDTKITGALATDDEVLTIKDGDGNSMGTITIAASGSAAGDEDSLVPSSNNTVAEGEWIEIETGGQNSNAERAIVAVTLRLS